MLKTSVAISFFGVLLGTVGAICPPEIVTRPCTCSKKDDGNSLRCENITEKSVLNGVFRRTTGETFTHLELVNASIESIPSSALVEKHIKTIGIVNSNLTTLFDRASVPPLNILKAINMKNVNFRDPFPWNQFKNLKKLILFLAIEVKIPALDSAFKNNVNKDLVYFALSNTSTVHIDDRVLSGFTRLEDVRIEKNPLTTYSRNYFPRPFKIMSLHLSGNKIESLPADAFIEMPRLQALDLSNNKLSAIPDRTFSQINHKLSYLELHDNHLNCGCGFNWLISNKPKYSLTGTCATPENVKGKYVKDLKREDLASCH